MAIEVSSSSELGRQIQDLANQVNIELDNMLTNVRNMIVSNIDISGLVEKDPTVPGWAKQPAKPSYSTDDIIGLQATITQQNESISALSSSVANKEDKVTGKGLSTNDYTDADKTSLASKVDKVTGKGLSTNDYTTDEKTKLAGIEAGAQVNVSADWEAAYGAAGYIGNKPDLNAMWQDIENDVANMLADYVLTTALTTTLADYAKKDVATTTAAGLMSAADKAKLDSL